MPKIRVEFTYEPNLEHYPPHIETAVQAMQFDVQQVEDGAIGLDDLMEGYDTEITVVP